MFPVENAGFPVVGAGHDDPPVVVQSHGGTGIPKGPSVGEEAKDVAPRVELNEVGVGTARFGQTPLVKMSGTGVTAHEKGPALSTDRN